MWMTLVNFVDLIICTRLLLLSLAVTWGHRPLSRGFFSLAQIFSGKSEIAIGPSQSKGVEWHLFRVRALKSRVGQPLGLKIQ